MKEKALNAAIDHLKKSPVLQEIRVAADSLMEQLNATFKREPVGLETLVEKLSNSTDRLILHTINAEKIDFLGGELTASLPPHTDKLSLKLKLYFRSVAGKTLLKENEKQLDSSVLTADSFNELREKGSIAFVVDAPSDRA